MNLSVNWVLQVDTVVYKFLNKIPRKDAERILIAINNLSNDPFSATLKMKDEGKFLAPAHRNCRFYEIIPQEKNNLCF